MISWGSSSRPDFLRNRPTLVTRGSFATDHRTSESLLTSSVRNFSSSKSRPRWPTRFWRKKTGPGLASFTAAAEAANTGDVHRRIMLATTMSKSRLVRCAAARASDLRRRTTGMPQMFSTPRPAYATPSSKKRGTK